MFSADPGGELPPYPDTLSRAFLDARKKAGLPDDLNLHSLRHFQATALDTVMTIFRASRSDRFTIVSGTLL